MSLHISPDTPDCLANKSYLHNLWPRINISTWSRRSLVYPPPPPVRWDIPHTHASSCLLLKDSKNIDFASPALISLICLCWWWLMMLSSNVLLIHFPGVSGHFFTRLTWKAFLVTPGPLCASSACAWPLVFWCDDARPCVQRDTGPALASIMNQFLAACSNILPR